MLRDQVVTEALYDQIRKPIKRKSVKLIRRLVDDGAGVDALMQQRDFRDAIVALTAMSFSPSMISLFVERQEITESVIVRTLEEIVRDMIIALKGKLNGKLN